MSLPNKIFITGGAGLVGQNLVLSLKARGINQIVVVDKHKENLQILQKLHPEVRAILADCADAGIWESELQGADAVVQLHAQIGGLSKDEFERNNILATENLLSAMKKSGITRLIHVSSSVVESVADDFYTNTKKVQEELVLATGLNTVVLRPTLMFGLFDRKHLGWLSRFMKKSPIFPIPGKGNVIRQPLYAGDFAEVIVNCLLHPEKAGVFNISGCERIEYIEVIREIRSAVGARCLLVRIPPKLFRLLLWLWSLVDRNPPFTVQQLDALLANEEFEMTDWPEKFDVPVTTFKSAIGYTFGHPVFSSVVLEF